MTISVSHVRRLFAAAAVVAASLSARTAIAGSPSKEMCIDAHSRGQDARDNGQISLARKLFLSCAQSACPDVVQGDCAQLADSLSAQQPSVTFAARDDSGADLPDTTVYIDDMLIVTRLDSGGLHDIDPGKHEIRFSHAGREEVVTIVVGTGEKARAIVAVFASPDSPATDAKEAAVGRELSGNRTTHPTGARLSMMAGGAMIAGGAALAVVGVLKVPSNCSISTHECRGAPDDPAIGQAASGVRLLNIGVAVGGVGVAAFVGGLIWYYRGAKTEEHRDSVALSPWFTDGGGGLALGGSL